MKFTNNSWSFLLLLYSCPWIYRKKHPWKLKDKKIHEFGSPGLNSIMHLNHLQSPVNTEWEVTQLRSWFSLSSAKARNLYFLQDLKWCWCCWSMDHTLRSPVYSGPSWSVWETETDSFVSAPHHFWISFQGEPEPPCFLGGPSSLCHCQKEQADPSFGCPSLPDTTWGCGSDQEFQQEADQRKHTGNDEWGCG